MRSHSGGTRSIPGKSISPEPETITPPIDLAASLHAVPPLTLVIGSAGAGKTEWALTRATHPSGRSLLIVPTSGQVDTLSGQLLARSDRSEAEVRSSVLTFHAFADTLCRNRDRNPGRMIGRAFQRLIVGEVIRATLRPDDYFGGMLRAPGFTSALLERIREWKLACLTPEDLEMAANPAAALLQHPHFERKACELARLFRAYQSFLESHRMRDEEDLLHLAADEAITATRPLPANAERVVVDGFYRFNRAQRRLLAALAGRGLEMGLPEAEPEVEVAVTLCYDTDRPVLFAASERTLSALRSEFACREIALPARLPDPVTPLTLLETGIYRTEVGSMDPPSAPQSVACSRQPAAEAKGDCPVLIFDAPNPYVEAEMAAREFRRLFDSGGYAWSDFAVILRTLGDYAPILAAVFERYGVPLGIDGPELLAENPLIKTVLHLLAVFRYGWQRDDVLAFLKSSYTAPEKPAADELRRRAQAAGVRSGRTAWLELAAGEGIASSVSSALREMARCEEELTAPNTTPDALADSIRTLLTTFGMEERIALGEPIRQERDLAALQAGLNVLEGLRDLFTLTGKQTTLQRPVEPLSFRAFYSELVSAWRSSSSIAAPSGDVVRVTEPYDTRDRHIKMAVVMGLTERVFPRRVTEDPFLRDEEREALRTSVGLELDAQRQRTDDERFLFYLAITAPSERLILSYPRSSDDSDTLPSFYLDEVRSTLAAPHLQTVSRTLADVAPRSEEAVSPADRLLAACAELFDPAANAADRESLQQAATRLQECLQSAQSPDEARRIVASRNKPRLPGLDGADLRAAFAAHKSVYSVSELETYGRCPFHYLLAHVLDLRQEADGSDPRAQGTLLHNVLRRYFRRRGIEAKQQKSRAATDPTMRATLQELLEEALADRSLDLTPHRLRMTRRLLSDALNGFTEREERFTAQFGMNPTHFELSFGVDTAASDGWPEDEDRDGRQPSEQGDDAPYDAASRSEPLLLQVADGAPVAVCGTIDRVDLDASGRRALVMDYKLGKPPEYTEVQRGASLQMPLYMLALERLFGKTAAVACYDSMRERGRRRMHRLEHVNLRQFGPILPLEDGGSVTPLNRQQFADLVRTAEETAVRLAGGIASARVEATPGDHCRSCPYGDVCRTTLGGHDGERLSEDKERGKREPRD